MDKDIENRMREKIGQLEALHGLARVVSCMPSDTATGSLLEVIRLLTDKAVISAARYAAERTQESV